MWFWYTLNFENHSSRAVVCSLMVVAPRGCLAMYGAIFGCHKWGRSATSIWWTETGDAAKYPTMRRQAPTDKIHAQMSKVLRLRETALGQRRVPFSLSSLGSSVSCEWSNNMQPNCWWFYLACSLQHLTNPRNWTYYFLISLSSSPVYSATAQSILTHVPPKKILLIFHFEFVLWNQTIGY